MTSKTMKALRFLRLVSDRNNRLSLTNLAVWVILVKLALSSSAISPVDVGALVGTLLSYQGKRWIGGGGGSDEASS